MPSPKIEVFPLFDSTTGALKTGQTPTFSVYKDDLGNNLAQPAITELGGGFYKFTPTFADLTKGIVYAINPGAGNSPASYYRYMRPEDWHEDKLEDLEAIHLGRWKIHNSGPDANRLVLYKLDGVTVLKKFDLRDLAGNPTISLPFERLPV